MTTETETELKIGDVVTLRSGGQQMTLCNILLDENDVGIASCHWFGAQANSGFTFMGTGGHGHDVHQTLKLPLAALVKVE